MRAVHSLLLNAAVSTEGVHGENKLISGKICFPVGEVTDCSFTCHQGNLLFQSKGISTCKAQDVAYKA